MSEANNSSQRSKGLSVEFRVPAHLESLSIVRTLMTAMGTHEDLDLDVVADLRLALDEACTALIRSAAPASTLVVTVSPREQDVHISVSTPTVREDVLRPGTFSWHVISSLTDDLSTFYDGSTVDSDGGVFGITMTARRPEVGR